MLIGIGVGPAQSNGSHASIPNRIVTDSDRRSMDAAFAVGTVHGLAGSSHVLGIAPALVLPSDGAAAAYLILFGAGSVAAMGLFSSLIGWSAGRPAASGLATQSALLGLCRWLPHRLVDLWLLSDPVSHTTRDLVAPYQ